MALNAQKVKTVEDKFYGTRYYRTDWIKVSANSGGTLMIRMRSMNGSDNILLESRYIGIGSAYSVSKKDNFILKFKDDSTLNLAFQGSIPDYATGVISGISWHTYTIEANVDITSMEKIDILTAARVETSEGFTNFEVKENAAKKLIMAFDNIKKAPATGSTKAK